MAGQRLSFIEIQARLFVVEEEDGKRCWREEG